ncbi:hypothetical protein RYX36_019850 [Vicia faba]
MWMGQKIYNSRKKSLGVTVTNTNIEAASQTMEAARVEVELANARADEAKAEAALANALADEAKAKTT